MNTEVIAEKLDELIAIERAKTVPFERRWIDAAEIGAMFGRSARYVLEQYACRPDFPKPFPGGHPRWLAAEVEEWAIEFRRKAA